MPFTYIGKMVDGKKVVIFLLKNDVQYVAQINDVLDGMYRVDDISDDEVVLTYIPMNARQTLALARNASSNETLGLTEHPTVGLPQLARQPNSTAFAK
jgi:hypothetical protein